MNTTKTPTIAEQFVAIKTTHNLAAFVGVDYQTFTFLLYRKLEAERYRSFTISKKNGHLRLIEAPIKPIRQMQHRIALALAALYKPRRCVHGFVARESIVRNAQKHCKRAWVINFDLKDFFHSVHFGRVSKIFQGWRFNFPVPVAQALAHLCCHMKRLPQGAPTSPVLSNIACDVLDRDLVMYVKQHGCRYTRYSDDITISTTKKELPPAIATVEEGQRPVLSPLLRQLVEKHRFSINDDKTRARDSKQRQDVTGLTVNITPNTTRKYVRQIRAMLAAWQRHGLDLAQAEHVAKWNKKDRRPGRGTPDFRKVVRGKIEFLGSVRGVRDPIYIKFLRLYCHLNPGANSKVLAMIDAETRDVFLCHASEDKELVVNPLAAALEAAGITYFLDSKEILWGDSVTNVINRALVRARFVIVVLSERSLQKHWPQKEMNAALAHEINSGKTRVLPLLVGTTSADRKRVWTQVALQGDKRYLEWEGAAERIVEALRPLLTRG